MNNQLNHIGMESMSLATKIVLLSISWIFGFIGVLNLSILPIILSSSASLLVIYKTYLEIKKLKNKDKS